MIDIRYSSGGTPLSEGDSASLHRMLVFRQWDITVPPHSSRQAMALHYRTVPSRTS